METMNRHTVRGQIEDVGIIPSLRSSSSDGALFAAEALIHAGIPILEITATAPGAAEVIADLARAFPRLVVGAGTVLDLDTARRCVTAGARFLASHVIDPDVLHFAANENVLALPGAMTPTEVMTATRLGADLIKIFPCAPLGGGSFIRALKGPFPHVHFVASGGVNQHTAADFIHAGAIAISVGPELIPRRAVEEREVTWITELARRFVTIVSATREERRAARHEEHAAP
jgi:2-dehydro-3-deoxyphosphogluconate aldolase/(4S)-4-hydroxy-2-oxoglutarate aldolase